MGLPELLKLMDLLGIDWDDFGRATQQTKTFLYSKSQEDFLAANPSCFAFFDQILNGNSVSSIQDEFSLTAISVHKYLKQLEDLKLIERLEDCKVKLLVSGEPRWRKNGPLANKFKHIVLNEVVDQSPHRFTVFLHQYLTEDIRLLKKLMVELAQQAKLAHQRAQAARLHSGQQRVKTTNAFVMGLMPFQWSILHDIENIDY